MTPYECKVAEFVAARNRQDGREIERLLEELRTIEPPPSNPPSGSEGNDEWIMHALIDESGH